MAEHDKCGRTKFLGPLYMQPMKHAIHADAGLISMLELTGNDQIGNALDRRSQPLCCQVAPLDQGSFRDLAPTDRRESLAGTTPWAQLPSLQIPGQPSHDAPICHR